MQPLLKELLNKNIQVIKKKFAEIQGNDPVLKINVGTIELKPNYWNFSFISNFPPIVILIFLVQNNALENDLIYILGICLFCYLTFRQLSYFNKIIIDLEDQSLKIIPCLVTAIYTKERHLHFDRIKSITSAFDTISPIFRRCEIKLLLMSSEKIKFINCKPELSDELVGALSQLLR